MASLNYPASFASPGTTDSGLKNSYGPEAAPIPDGPEVVSSRDATTWQTPPYSKGNNAVPAIDNHSPSRKGKRLLGLPVVAFWAIIGAGVLVISLGVGLGVGLGSKKSSSDSDNSGAPATASNTPASVTADSDQESSASPSASATESSESTSTSSAPVTSGTTGIADNSCDSSSPETYFATRDEVFTAYCAIDWPNGIELFDDSSATVSDIYSDIVYTFEACMDLCVDYNVGRDDALCNAVTYASNLTSSIAGQGANCWLKDGRGLDYSARDTTASAVRVP
ncbi:hypothetical protein MKZ38_010695 [Zalerion maritima]|uniref:Uncharacterized protein n=1 Tax=Zalerion maritima TaxID=339359 RepID=A0AAD5RTQ7_9PEZI|nr:hypothetical protein MKZ38_010695 [Zalerion maritima]